MSFRLDAEPARGIAVDGQRGGGGIRLLIGRDVAQLRQGPHFIEDHPGWHLQRVLKLRPDYRVRWPTACGARPALPPEEQFQPADVLLHLFVQKESPNGLGSS